MAVSAVLRSVALGVALGVALYLTLVHYGPPTVPAADAPLPLAKLTRPSSPTPPSSTLAVSASSFSSIAAAPAATAASAPASPASAPSGAAVVAAAAVATAGTTTGRMMPPDSLSRNVAALTSQATDAFSTQQTSPVRQLQPKPTTSGGMNIGDANVACRRMTRRYNVVPGSSWGSLTPALQQRWTSLKCDEIGKYRSIAKPLRQDTIDVSATSMVHAEGFPPVAKSIQEWCLATRAKHHVQPMKSWGSLTPTLIDEWKQRRCDFVFTMFRMSKTALPNCSASQSASQSDALPLIAVMAASTTRNVQGPAVGRLALFSYLLPSLMRTADCGFRYEYVLGYDAGDAFYDSAKGMEDVQRWFREGVQAPLAARGVALSLRTVRVNNSVKKPGPVFLEMARAAYAAGATYFFRVNDDTELLEPWAAAFTKTLEAVGSPFGVVGPLCTEGNDKILTHDFVHRTHMDIFGMNYYPPALNDWWMDDWISFVYGQTRTFKATSIPVIHHTGAHGQRYQVDKSHQSLLKDLVRDGQKMIRQYMLKHELAEGVLKRFDADRFDVGFMHRDIPLSVKSQLAKLE